jgi:hypothetical protein
MLFLRGKGPVLFGHRAVKGGTENKTNRTIAAGAMTVFDKLRQTQAIFGTDGIVFLQRGFANLQVLGVSKF